MRNPTALLAAICLTACGQPQPPAEAPPVAADPVAEPAASGKSASPEPAPPQPLTIPAAFQGVWAATTDDCEKPAETRLEMSADHLRFYESSGKVASVDASQANEILVTVALSGEGALSQRSFRYRLIDGGEGLFDVRNGLRRIRCPTA